MPACQLVGAPDTESCASDDLTGVGKAQGRHPCAPVAALGAVAPIA